jgi:hypothetical protein|nr:MAG TPA: hypothetical protein [Caudoviricetes sp.]
MDKTIRVAVAKMLNNKALTTKQKQYKLLDVALLVLCRKDVSEATKRIVDNWYEAFKAYNTLKNL